MRAVKPADRWRYRRSISQPGPIPLYKPSPMKSPILPFSQPLSWAYGVTTVPSRMLDGTLDRTLLSLRGAGFDAPRLFVDGVYPSTPNALWRKYLYTERRSRIRLAGNWHLGLLELFHRQPLADRYAIFQDDILCVQNIRQYLDRAQYPIKGYLNLYTRTETAMAAPRGRDGKLLDGIWHQSPTAAREGDILIQGGKGALALVFNREAVIALLTSPHMLRRLYEDGDNVGWRKVDGGVVTAMNHAGFREYVMVPSLVQHAGKVSTIDKAGGRLEGDPGFKPKIYHDGSPTYADTFPGEDWDAMNLSGSSAQTVR